MTNPATLLAAASRLDLSVYTEHATGCPLWYDEHRRARPLSTVDKPCSCGLAEQLEAVRVIAEFVRELFGQEQCRFAEVVVGVLGPVPTISVRIYPGLSLSTLGSLALAADLIRACADVDARAATPEEP